MTVPAVHRRVLFVSNHTHERNHNGGRVSKPESHGLGLQVPYCLHSEMPTQDPLCWFEATPGRRISSTCGAKGCEIVEGHLTPDHVHMMIAIPPNLAASQVVGSIKSRSAIHLARVYVECKRNFVGQHFWGRGNSDLSTVTETRQTPPGAGIIFSSTHSTSARSGGDKYRSTMSRTLSTTEGGGSQAFRDPSTI